MMFFHIAFWPTLDVSFVMTSPKETTASKNKSQVGPGRKNEIMGRSNTRTRSDQSKSYSLLFHIKFFFVDILRRSSHAIFAEYFTIPKCPRKLSEEGNKIDRGLPEMMAYTLLVLFFVSLHCYCI